MNDEIRALTAERDALFSKMQELREQSTTLQQRRDRAVQEYLDELTDAEIGIDETLKRWVLKEAFSHGGAHRRIQVLADPGVPGVVVRNIDGRDEYISDCLPCLTVVATEVGQDIPAVAAAIRSWAAAWALGRPEIPLAVMDADCSAYGSHAVRYDVATDQALMLAVTYGRPSTEVEGSLVEVLSYIAQKLSISQDTETF